MRKLAFSKRGPLSGSTVLRSIRRFRPRPGLPPSAIRETSRTSLQPTTTGDFVLPFDLSYDADLAYDYFELRSADAQKQLLDDTVKAYPESLQLTINRFDGGAAPKSDVAQAQAQLETTKVQDTDIAVQRAQFEHATVGGYRETTLTALQQVEDNLAALRILEQEAWQQKDATASAQESLQIFTDRYIGGAYPYLQVLTAQTIALQNERNDVDILRRRMDASVLLIKALGGGWDVSQLPQVASFR